MKRVDIADATNSLASFSREAIEEPIVVTEQGAPVAVLMRADDVDLETVAVWSSPVFQAMIERSRAQHRAGDVVSVEEVRRSLGID
jgi:PHD/YefM family antitoxin component YafN of YafNO toxin-antitoxin module